ncbi:rRNA maturation RNase YbeY [Lentiprolixibacter aurantiacus]|uniref:Endoribonuclease YbeY n=1 Tax=Lentiprolixibacter aurantiacus TaxID=2993939 RepID=A0AAE3MJ39_9FLAO|nr:rRNA maturation RNase YbeY [Lentiprolixibacter aurantiacus]MCX2718518.1 rRNA maturation RNase YbeY [Lentiprolixibacter aurantiacus]
MIEFCYETDFKLANEEKTREWITDVVKRENRTVNELVYIFCDDNRLLELNQKYLNHNTLTDILTFPYSDSEALHADIFISIPRVKENSQKYGEVEEEEIRRVMVHGVLHLIGYQDDTDEAKQKMRAKEDEKLRLFHVER